MVSIADILPAPSNQSLEELLPSGVAWAELREAEPYDQLLPEELRLGDGMVKSRRREFLLGRACARRALTRLGLPAAPILRGPKGEPLWPRGAVGSITHCEGYWAAAVTTQPQVKSIGIDAELDATLPAEVVRHVCSAQEIAQLSRLPRVTHWDRILFSAKESIYKAWFPITGRWLGFKDVRVSFSPHEGTFDAQLLVAPPRDAQWLTRLQGRFLVREGLVMTATAILA